MNDTKELNTAKAFKPSEHQLLIVEDSMTQLTQLMMILEEAGFNVITSTNGIDALHLLESVDPSLVLTDINMPGIDGYELCKRIKNDKKHKNIPVILLTFMTDPEDVIRGLKAGADNFIPKPFSSDDLLSRIKQLLIHRDVNVQKDKKESLEVYFAGSHHKIDTGKIQILDLLLSTFESAVAKNNELIRMNSELRLLRIQLEKKNAELLTINEEKNRFVGMAAHDIRNPLGNIYSFADLLLKDFEGSASEKQLSSLDLIKKSSKDLLTLVNELLDVSQIESGKISSNFKESDIVECLKQNIEKNSYIAEKKNISIEVNIPNHELKLTFDFNRIDQVLDNLMSNAIKYSNQNTRLKVTLEHSKNNIKISIEDQGVGIDANELDRLFEPFVSLSSQTTEGEPSTGLGLFTCKKIIESHKGKIDASSELGKGTKVRFTLPIVHA